MTGTTDNCHRLAESGDLAEFSGIAMLVEGVHACPRPARVGTAMGLGVGRVIVVVVLAIAAVGCRSPSAGGDAASPREIRNCSAPEVTGGEILARGEREGACPLWLVRAADAGLEIMVQDDSGRWASTTRGRVPDSCAGERCQWSIASVSTTSAAGAEAHAQGQPWTVVMARERDQAHESPVRQVWLGLGQGADLGFAGLWSGEHVFEDHSDAGPRVALRPLVCGERLALGLERRVAEDEAGQSAAEFGLRWWIRGVAQPAPATEPAGDLTPQSAEAKSAKASGAKRAQRVAPWLSPLDPPGDGLGLELDPVQTAAQIPDCAALELPLP